MNNEKLKSYTISTATQIAFSLKVRDVCEKQLEIIRVENKETMRLLLACFPLDYLSVV